MVVGYVMALGNKATSEISIFIEDLGNAKFNIVIEVMDFTSQEQKQTFSTGKFSFELLKLESEHIRISNPTIIKISEDFMSTYELSDLGKEFFDSCELLKNFLSPCQPIGPQSNECFMLNEMTTNPASFTNKGTMIVIFVMQFPYHHCKKILSGLLEIM